MSYEKIEYIKLPRLKKTDAIVLACLNALLEGASDMDDTDLLYRDIPKNVYDECYYCHYEGLDNYSLALFAPAMQAAMDAILEGYDNTQLDEIAVCYHGSVYTYIEVERAYIRLGFRHKTILKNTHIVDINQ
jgi:hypothetical protein